MVNEVFYRFLQRKGLLPAGLGLCFGFLAAFPGLAKPAEAAAETHPARAEEPAPAPRTLRYQVTVAGQPAGEMSLRESRDQGRRLQETSMRLEFQRAGDRQSLAMASRFVEAEDGQPLEAWSRQELGAVPVETTYRFVAGRIEIESRQGDNVVQRQVPDPGDWLAPSAAQDALERHLAAALAGGAGRFSIRSFDPLLGPQVVGTEWVLEARDDTYPVDGRPLPASRWRQTQSFAPQVATTAWLSAEGDLLASRTQLAGLDMTIALTEKPTSGVADLGAGALPPEMLTGTFVHPDRPLSRPRAQRRVVYQLGAGAPLELATVGYQRVDPPRQDGERWWTRVVVDLDRPVPALPEEQSVDALAPYLAASIFLNHENAEVRALHRRALADWRRGGPAQRAERLRSFVHGYLETKDLRTVLATASEVATRAAGDCTEHAVLLAALLRAEKIPARVAFGLIYVDRFAGQSDIFGYHMWTQAWLDGHWVDLDATLKEPFDAAHLTLGTSGLDEEVSALAAMTGALELFAGATLQILAPR